jgi:hypothetical protein
MSHKEFTRWMAFYSLQPFGPRRDNIHAAMIASTVANCHSEKRFTTKDFMISDEVEDSKSKTMNFIANIRNLAEKKGQHE